MGAIREPVEFLAEDLTGKLDRQRREQVFLEQAQQFGVTRYAYLNTARANQPPVLETNYAPEWIGRYLCQSYATLDPVSLEGHRSRQPFRWRAALAMPHHDRPLARQVFNEAAEFGLRDGFAVPIHSPSGLTLISMAVEDPSVFGKSAASLRRALQTLALQYHQSCERALADDPVLPVTAAAMPPPRLTAREREVLLWTAKGKTGWEIAQILNVAERTVVYHIENAKTKLGVSSRSHAVVVAVDLGLIDP